MEKILVFKESIKNKMKEKLQSNLDEEIFQKEKDILNLKEKYNNMKKGFFIHYNIEDVENDDLSGSFFLSKYLLLICPIIFLKPIIEYLISYQSTLFFVLSILTMILFSSIMIYSIYPDDKDEKTMLRESYQKSILNLKLLQQKSLNLNSDLNSYIEKMKNREENLNNSDIISVSTTLLSKLELEEIAEIFTKEELSYLSINASQKAEFNEKAIQISYSDILNLITHKKKYNTEEVVELIFNK